ncbi:MAG: C4-type zinc ribbon domain-containing protein [Candidatus Phosphoribacter sp.]
MELQGLDTRLDQLAHARSAHPSHARLKELRQRSAVLDRELALARTALSDIQRDVDKAEADVQLVRDRAARNQQRLDSGTGSPKDLLALQHELVSLARRQGDLEDLELEVMERAETLAADVARHEASRVELDSLLAEAVGEQTGAFEVIDAEATEVASRRSLVAPDIGAELLALYDKIRAGSGGIGAAELTQRRCTGCRLELNQVDLSNLKNAAADEVLRCEECRRILVRTPESGL